MISEISQHVNIDRPENNVSLERVNILTVENEKSERGVKAIHIRVTRVTQPSLNRDGCWYLLPAVWTNLLRARVKGPH